MPRDYEKFIAEIEVQDKLLNKIQRYIKSSFVLEHPDNDNIKEIYDYLEHLKGRN